MDESNNALGYVEDMYGFGEFDEPKSVTTCSHCGQEGHRIERHREGPKNRPRSKRNRGGSSSTRVSFNCRLLRVVNNLFLTVISLFTLRLVLINLCNVMRLYLF